MNIKYKTVRFPLTRRQIRLSYFMAFVAIIGVSVSAFAASVTINNSTNAGYQGNYVVDNGFFTVGQINYNVIEAVNTATTQPMAWSNGGTAYVNTSAAGNWEIAWTLTVLTGATASHTYTITVSSTANSGTTTQLYTFQFTTAATITNGQTMTILYDTGATTWTAPSALQVTVA